MRLLIVAAGRIKSAPERPLYEMFAGRLKGVLDLIEIEEKRKLSGSELVRAEAALIRAAIPRGALRVALDRRGKSLTSEELAARLSGWIESGRDVAFLIGGADGLDPSLPAEADLVLSFGAATWPHFLARVMLAEQLYRAQSIRADHPYHRPG